MFVVFVVPSRKFPGTPRGHCPIHVGRPCFLQIANTAQDVWAVLAKDNLRSAGYNTDTSVLHVVAEMSKMKFNIIVKNVDYDILASIGTFTHDIPKSLPAPIVTELELLGTVIDVMSVPSAHASDLEDAERGLRALERLPQNPGDGSVEKPIYHVLGSVVMWEQGKKVFRNVANFVLGKRAAFLSLTAYDALMQDIIQHLKRDCCWRT